MHYNRQVLLAVQKEIYEKFIEDLKKQVDFFRSLVKDEMLS